MSVVQTDRALTVKFSDESKTIQILLESGYHDKFKYTFRCSSTVHSRDIDAFFDVDSGRCLMVVGTGSKYKYIRMKFWITDDVPTLSATWPIALRLADSI